MRWRAAFLVLALMNIQGCSPQSVAVSTPFVASEYGRYALSGTARVEGQAFLRQSGGSIVTCAGTEVELLPDTAYVVSALAILEKGGKAELGEHTGEISRFGAVRKATCDAQGNFVFDKLPTEDWIVVSSVTWNAGDDGQGGILIKDTSTKTGSTRVILSSDDLVRH
jgi:hypothetical protein